jgi:hypothetical protein
MTISDEEVEKRKLSLIVGGNVNLVQLWKPVLRFLKKLRTAIRPSTSLLGIYI